MDHLFHLTSSCSIFAKVRGGQVTSMQLMKDTFGTTATFRAGGAWKFRRDPVGEEVEA